MRKTTIAICLRCSKKYPQNISFQEVCSKCSNEICSLRVYGLKGKWTKIKELKSELEIYDYENMTFRSDKCF